MNNKPRYKQQSNVSDPLINTRADGQWDYKPKERKPVTVVKPATVIKVKLP